MLLLSRPVLLVASLAVLAPVFAGGVSAHPRPDAPVRVSDASPYEAGCLDVEGAGLGRGFTDAEAEVSLAVHPARPGHLVAAWMQDLYSGYVTATSRDGGRTWGVAVVPGISRCSGGEPELAADPSLGIGPDGTVYLTGFSLDLPHESVPTPIRSRLQVSTSGDGGDSWSQPVVLIDDEVTLHDKPSLTADPLRAGVAHVVWTQESTAFGPLSTGISFVTTRDGGRTWSAPRTVLSPQPPTSIPHGSELLVLSDGSLLVLATMLPGLLPHTGRWLPHTVQAVRSADGGTTWSQPVTVAEFEAGDASFNSGSDPDDGQPVQAPSAFTGADVAPDGTVHVVWRHAVGERSAEIRTSRTSDGGRTWSAARTVTSVGAQVFLPHLAVADDGTVGVSYHDVRRDAPGDDAFTADVWLARSGDGGDTWIEEHLVGPMDLREAPLRDVPAQGRFLGDYHGLVGTDRGFAAALALPAPLAQVGATDVFFVRVEKHAPRTEPGRRR